MFPFKHPLKPFQFKILLFLDNSAIHKKSYIYNLASEYNLCIMFNAPYSPYLNSIEFAFEHIKRKLRGYILLNK